MVPKLQSLNFTNLVPLEDEDVSKQFERSFKSRNKSNDDSSVESGHFWKNGKATVKTAKAKKQLKLKLYSAVGIATNIENIGLEDVGIVTDKGK